MRTVVAVVFLASACLTPMTQPEPQRTATPAAAIDVVRRAASSLTELGFEVQVSDADAGLLTMRRTRGARQSLDITSCNWQPGSIAEVNGFTTVTVSISARRGGDVTHVVTSVRTMVAWPKLAGGPLAMADSDEFCRSNGKVEDAIAAAVRGTESQ